MTGLPQNSPPKLLKSSSLFTERGGGDPPKTMAMTFFQCRHILPSGKKCKGPALRGKPYCYFHTRLHRSSADTGRPPQKDEPLELPIMEDRSSIQIALSQVLGAICSGHLDHKRAGLVLYGLQIASQHAAHEIVSTDAVDSITRTAAGDELGPKKRACDPPDDCYDCERWQTCDDPECLPEEDEAEEGKAESQPAESGLDALRRSLAKVLDSKTGATTALTTASSPGMPRGTSTA